ncbi:phosphotransferase family protein [Amycolatopsis acidiphila]|uniref:Phosphotransferase family protein n=1 Tax=Amycolatopsis acidiphila TaxID=715473 RepID=A0A558AI29_9PSEU|nr:phosphotransferase family protein [Amycolatopsis acidiphila]TVT23889.1 phosphotransferase family protein [Amycolatopsis acidiphila]UIJ61133.1 phosphotransferase family protein [Amycolatopsis acidiphila]GHG86520.1 aminoglycoside phosphotransferase [Amycolatopsis acidiphila]
MADDDQVPIERLRQFLRDAMPAAAELASVERLSGGLSCLTYAIGGDGWEAILRRAPQAVSSSRAYDFAHEFRILERMWANTEIPVPKPLALCEDAAIIGAPFYVMERVKGLVLQRHMPEQARATVDGTRAAALLVDALGALSDVAPELMSSRRNGGAYLERQLALFRKLWAANRTRPIPEVEELAGWLERNRPATQRLSAVHGDFKLDNVMFSAGKPLEIAAVLDWELATAGDPLVDLGWLVFFLTRDDHDDLELGEHAIRAGSPFPPRAALAQAYAERTGLSVDALPWYVALSGFKLAAIMEGSYRRYLEGDRSQPKFAGLEQAVMRWARRGLRAARGELSME